MNADGPSMLSLVAAAIYCAVVAPCLAATFVAVLRRQSLSHVATWGALALFFAALVYLRITNLEEIWREEFRVMMRAEGLYATRRAIQSPLAALILVLFALAVSAWIVRGYRPRPGRRNVAVAMAQLGALVMVGTIALRMVSFSLIDKFLYGPFKLNWFGDIGSALLVAGCAAYYTVVVITPQRRKKPNKSA